MTLPVMTSALTSCQSARIKCPLAQVPPGTLGLVPRAGRDGLPEHMASQGCGPACKHRWDGASGPRPGAAEALGAPGRL